MKVIHAVNVADALSQALSDIPNESTVENTRNGSVYAFSDPVCTVYQKPLQRVLFSKTRDANPYFHLMESLWMLAGRNDLKWPQFFNSRFNSYSDDGKKIHGAYGHRWRSWYGIDQIFLVMQELKNNPNTRRAVIGMWSPLGDLTELPDNHGGGLKGKDVPCNTQIYFDIRGGKLNMTVCCRSNDVLWGAYGANAVHFSFLMEYVAAGVGVEVGIYRQVSNNLHLYSDILDPKSEKARLLIDECIQEFSYDYPEPQRLVTKTTGALDADLRLLSDMMDSAAILPSAAGMGVSALGLRNIVEGVGEFLEPWMNQTMVPLLLSYCNHKEGNREEAVGYAHNIRSRDWAVACLNWLDRRYEKDEQK